MTDEDDVAQVEELRAAGRPVPSAAGAMTEARQDQLDAIDPGWYPVWDTGRPRRTGGGRGVGDAEQPGRP
ncbi:hypothetical protein ACFVH0_16915 [Streptomyces sp. NPDC127117]|uniref:hypothetical protein n=1 Tax=Streptomyces sp. NPDC127117 TaxID=3345368 RepID=UPI00362BB061